MEHLPEDISMMADYLGRDDPAIQRLLKTYMRDPQMADTVDNLLKRRCVQTGFNPDEPPVFWPIKQLPPGFVTLGKIEQGSVPGPEFSLPTDIIMQHLGIFGHNGTGKSYLAMHLAACSIQAGFKVWILDIEDEYSRLVPMFPAEILTVVEPHQLRINLFQPPGDRVTPISWLDELSLLMRGGMFLRDGSLNIFRLGMNKILERKNANPDQTPWPALTEVIEFFQGMKFGPKSRTAGYIESLLNRLTTLADFYGPTAGVVHSDMLENLSQRSVIFRLHGLTGIPLQYLVNFLLIWLARHREVLQDPTPHLVIIEEAHMLSSERARIDIGENILCRMFRTARKRGIALILCDQVPSELPPAILGNLACRIVMRLAHARCIWSAQGSMGLNREQADSIATLKLRRAIVQYSLHPRAFMIEVPQMNFAPAPDKSELHQLGEKLLSESQWTEYARDNEGSSSASVKLISPDDLTGDVFVVMKRLCEEPAETIEERCRKLQLDRAREFRARAELDTKGLICRHEQAVGGKTRFFQPTDKGIEWAQKRHIRVKKFKSGIVHEYLLCQVEKRIGLIGTSWRLQRNSSIARDQGLQPDLLVLGPDGRRIIIEICCHNLEYDAENLLIEAAIPQVDLALGITPDKQTKAKLEKALKKNSSNSTEDPTESIRLLDASQVLAEGFNWSELLMNNGKRKGDLF